MAELKEAAESTWSEETTTNTPVTVNSTTDVQSDDQLQGSTDDNSPLLLPSTPTIISEVGCKISLGQISGFEVLGCKISLGQISDGLGKPKTRFRIFGIDVWRNGFN